LRELRNAKSHSHVTNCELSERCETQPGKIASRIAALREAGYEIEEHPHFGFRLLAAPDRLIADDLAAMLDGCTLVREILVFQRTDSTNDVAAQLSRSGSAEGAIIFAEAQSAGRGRLGRKWDSPAHEGLWFSILLRPKIPIQEWTRLTTLAAVAIAQGIESVIENRAAIKWPNDIYLGDKKAVGILIESHAGENGFAVLGIGVNVNQTQFPGVLADRATSLRQFTGHVFDRQLVAVAILRELDALYPKMRDRFSEIVAAAEARSYLRGRKIECEFAGRRICGVAETLDENGALILRNPDGSTVTLHSGEATIASI